MKNNDHTPKTKSVGFRATEQEYNRLLAQVPENLNLSQFVKSLAFSSQLDISELLHSNINLDGKLFNIDGKLVSLNALISVSNNDVLDELKTAKLDQADIKNELTAIKANLSGLVNTINTQKETLNSIVSFLSALPLGDIVNALNANNANFQALLNTQDIITHTPPELTKKEDFVKKMMAVKKDNEQPSTSTNTKFGVK